MGYPGHGRQTAALNCEHCANDLVTMITRGSEKILWRTERRLHLDRSTDHTNTHCVKYLVFHTSCTHTQHAHQTGDRQLYTLPCRFLQQPGRERLWHSDEFYAAAGFVEIQGRIQNAHDRQVAPGELKSRTKLIDLFASPLFAVVTGSVHWSKP